jgi:hypothetical protein
VTKKMKRNNALKRLKREAEKVFPKVEDAFASWERPYREKPLEKLEAEFGAIADAYFASSDLFPSLPPSCLEQISEMPRKEFISHMMGMRDCEDWMKSLDSMELSKVIAADFLAG